jgi:hypothetical protein
MEIYDVNKLFSSSHEAFTGFPVNVTIKAAIVIRGRECFLVKDLESLDSDYRIEVFSPGLEKKFDLLIGGWVGGPVSYFDLVTISGTLSFGTTRRDVASISNITHLSLERDGELFSLL